MSVEKDVARYSRAAEAFENADKDRVAYANRQEAIMKKIILKYFMTDDETAFYSELLNSPSNYVRVMASSDMGYVRYNLESALAICQAAKKENWMFSNDAGIQNRAEIYMNNTTYLIEKSISEQKIFGDNRLFRQIDMYRVLLVDYDNAWSDSKILKAQETWQILLDYVKQIIAEGKQDKFFDEMLENSQNFQKMITAMVSAALSYDKARSMRTLHSLVTNNSMSPINLNFAAIQLERMKNGIPIDGLWE